MVVMVVISEGDGREIKRNSAAPRGVHVRNTSVSGTFPLQLATW